MDSQEFKNQLRPLALQRNLAQHPCSLKVLRKSVAKAVNVCGKRPKDKNLAFALRFLCAYPAIESTFLL
ncbi:hypothetical protein HXX76_010038 [Chlamydomonas incerta]|uniref:Uncharacterized protein n=1 Tax=Chlamydomonas incerta TaxID=51695 RepID=A0A835T140_CHLIN|nr:hypothetical protein HXX76_010038 [Chlamydomonas incerta]|eukprot:KAG2430515.1 hypothetical protein HXX76_010038 [Chlamydomonas incerta]